MTIKVYQQQFVLFYCTSQDFTGKDQKDKDSAELKYESVNLTSDKIRLCQLFHNM